MSTFRVRCVISFAFAVLAVALPMASHAQTVTTTLTTGIGNFPLSVAVNPVTNKIYVANHDSANVTVIDGSTNSTTTVATGAGTFPRSVAVNAVTNKIYVANEFTTTVTVIDGATNSTTNVTAGTNPVAVAVNPVTNRIYVANSGSNSVTVIDGATNVPTKVATGREPVSVSVNPVTNKIYVTDSFDNNVTVINGADNSTSLVATGNDPVSVAVNPVTNKIYVANFNSANVTVIDGATNNATNVSVRASPVSLAVNPVTNQIYVANSGSGSVTVIDGPSNGTTNVATGNSPNSVAVNPATNKIYVINESSNNVTVIDGASNTTTTEPVGTFPVSAAANPVTNKIYVTNEDSNSVTVIDGATNTTATVPAGIATFSLAVNPVTNQIYLANNGSIDSGGADPGSLMVIDGATNIPTTIASPAGTTSPRAVVVNPLTNKIYIANEHSSNVTVIDGANGNSTTAVAIGGSAYSLAVNLVTNKIYVPTASGVAVIDGASNSTTTIAAGTPFGVVAVNPVTNKIYATTSGNSVAVIDGATDAVTTTVPAAVSPNALAVNPVTNKIYVVNYDFSTLGSGGLGSLTVIDGATNTVAATVTLGVEPVAIALNPVTNKIYITDFNGGAGAGSITVIDANNGNSTTTITAGEENQTVAVNPVTNKIYVGGIKVTVIDGATNSTTTVTAGETPEQIAVNPVTNKIYVANAGNGFSSSTVTVIDEEQVQAIPLTTSITPLANNQTTNPTPSFTFNAASTTVTVPDGVYFQVDTWQNAWSEATGSNPTFTGTLASLQPGFHILYAYAGDGQEATSTEAVSPLTGAIQAYGFLVSNTVQVTVGTSQAGLSFTVDGTSYTSTQTFAWKIGDSHTIATTSPQPGTTGTQYLFTQWSDGTTNLSDIITVPSTATTYTANFKTQYLLTTAASPTVGGTVSAGGYYDAGANAPITATPNTNYAFVNWTGAVAAVNSASTIVTMSGPQAVTANFQTGTVQVMVGTNVAGVSFTVDGTPYTAAQTLSWTIGSPHTLSTTSTQSGATGTQYVFTQWSDGTKTLSDTVMASASTTSYTASFKTQYLLTTAASPTAGGTVSAGGYYDAGTNAPVTATPNANYVFVSWTGSVAAVNSASTIVTMSAPQTVTANFQLGTVQITVGTNVTGASFTVDSQTYTASQVLTWNLTSSHTIGTTSPKAGTTGIQYVFTGWSDGGGISHPVTASAGTTSYTASFKTQFLLTTAVSPVNTGSATGGGTYYDAGSNAPLTATPNTNYVFVNWTGAAVANANNASTTATMTGPQTVTANFQLGTVQVTVGTNIAGASFPVDTQTYTSTQTLTWNLTSSHTIGTTSPQAGTTGIQYVFTGWSDSGAISHPVTASASTTSYTASFKTQYLLTAAANPAAGGMVTGGGAYYDAGSNAPITATANPTYLFTNWSGPAAASSSASTTVPMTTPQSVTANFQLATIQVAVGSNPAGASFSVDNTSYSSAQTFTWVISSSHTIATTSPQTIGGNADLSFVDWSDGGAISHSVVATASTLNYTANFSGVSATFQPLDTTTQGNWPGNYGQDGYIITNDAHDPPSYATVNFPGASTYTWVASSADPRALLKSPTATDRIASTYYAANSFTIDVTLTGGPHQVALYLLDLDTTARTETISILDPNNNNAVLDTRSFSGFHNGEYAIWNLQGHVLIQVTNAGGLNSVVSGVFFRTLNPVNPPTVSITAPTPGTVTGPVTITANVQSTVGIQSAQFLLDGNNLGSPVTSGTAGNYSLPWATPTTTNGPHTLSATALDTLGQSTTSTGVAVTVSNSTPPPSGSVVFLRTDTSTQGNWKTNYGADGELIANDSSHVPFYATVGLGNALQWTWAASTADIRALTKYNSATDRIASAYYNTPSFTLDVNLVDNAPHQVALYILDWDDDRTETVSILDANNNQVLDTHTLSSFNGGQYLVWNMQGHVLVKVQITNGVSAVVSGIFFGTAGATTAPPTVSISSPAPNATLSGTTTLTASASSTAGIASVQFVLDGTTNLGTPITSSPCTYQWNTTAGVSNGPHTLTAIATDSLSQQTTSTAVSVTVNNAAPATSVTFVAKDTTTEGTWKTHYGSDGEVIANDSNNPPGYAVLAFNGSATYTWATNITDLRALQQAAGGNRIASTFYATNNFSLDVNLTDSNTHQLALYFLDWDDGGRAQTVTVVDANTQAVLNTQPIANFQNGAYLIWNIKGHVTIQFNRTAGQNAVVSGVFLAPGV